MTGRNFLFRVALLLPVLVSFQSYAQQWMVPVDSANKSILTNPHIQFEATEAIDDMYNFNFERAKNGFNALKKQYGWHPLPYFLQGMNNWWQIIPHIPNETYDEAFYAEMDTALILSKRLYEEVNEVEGAFFLAITHAFRGRLLSERGQYAKSAVAGRNTLKYLGEVRGKTDYSPEILFADALFNYYAVWIRENYPLLRPLMALFPKGDKGLGIAQLKEVANNAFYSRTEAQYYLMRLLALEENDMIGGVRMASYLHESYPNNAYFHRFYARLLYQTGKYRQASEESKLILARVDSAYQGYESNSARYASFYLGHINELQYKYEEAIGYFNQAIAHSEKIGATDKGYYFYSFLHLGRIEEKNGNEDKAREYYKKVRKVSKRSHGANKQAKAALKRLRS
ncbi:MAG: tetratricopeptide repeat protein [Cytophagales bacterium]|nr:tetratricopeptide repeat protein [Cytophagales bacterium]